jgi:iron complex outermembrane receptor protein
MLWLRPSAASSELYLSAPDTALFVLDTLTVTAGRYERPVKYMPYAFSIVEQVELERVKKGVSLEEALRTLPGVQVSNRYNLSQGDRIAIRGLGSRASFGVRGIKVLLDGIPLTMPDGQTQLNNIDLASIGRIEILRGPSSSLYGNASGGVLLVESRKTSEKLKISQQLSIGSDGYEKSTTAVAGTVRRTSYSLNYTALRSDGFRDHSETQNHIVNIIAKQKISSAVEMSTVFSYFEAPYMLNASSLTKADALGSPRMARTFVKQQGSGKQVTQMQGGLTIKMQQSHIGTLQTTLYGLSRSLDNAIPGRVIGVDRLAGGVRTTWSRNFTPFGFHSTLLVGSDIERQQDARIEYENNGITSDYDNLEAQDILKNVTKGEKLLQQDETVLNSSVFAELVLRPLPSWSFTGGVRVDRYDFEATDQLQLFGVSMSGERRMRSTSPMFAVTYQYSPHINLYSLYSTAFQTPTTTELSNRADAIGGFNPQLGPEKIRNFEVGLKGLLPSHRLQLSLAAYHLVIRDLLIPYQIKSEVSEEIYFRNAGQARNAGFESALHWYATSWFTSSIAYTFSNFQYTDYRVQQNGVTTTQLAGNDVPGVPRHLFNFRCDIYHGDVNVGLNVNASGSYFTNDYNGPVASDEKPDAFINDAFLVLDLDLEYDVRLFGQDVTFYGLVENLLKTRHNRSIVPNAFANRFFEPAAGRSFYLGLKLDVVKN